MNSPQFAVTFLLLISICPLLCGCQEAEGHLEEQHVEHHAEHPTHKIVVTRPVAKDVISTQQYVCQIHSRRHIEIRALDEGYLEAIKVQEGQAVKQDELLFTLMPVLYQAKLDSEIAEAKLAKIKVDNTRRLVNDKVVSKQELALAEAELAKVEAKVELAQAERDFADIKAPFDGIVDRQHSQQGSLIEEGEILTTLSDNDVMWAYFNVPEARYLDYKTRMEQDADELQVELMLANGVTFPEPGEIGAIEADFNNETGNIAFRADFPNPDGLLRHGQTGTVLIHRKLHDAIVIPQRATYEILAKQYVYVIDEDDIVRQREIEVSKELEDIYVIKQGLNENDRIIFEGIRQVRDGDKVEFEFRDPTEILDNLKNHAE
ncbi:MAG: efflux RND transporter periplasmic adaptor subunit [Planctomycetaceae bacterium]|nr:efflux RND transporter periplasmic adaptor subunit [Planctomycetaceae bacterium]